MSSHCHQQNGTAVAGRKSFRQQLYCHFLMEEARVSVKKCQRSRLACFRLELPGACVVPTIYKYHLFRMFMGHFQIWGQF